jgi:hypothetical protein
VLAVPSIAASLQTKIDAAAAAYDTVVTPFASDDGCVSTVCAGMAVVTADLSHAGGPCSSVRSNASAN